MYSKVVICLAICALSSVSAGVVPVAAPLAAAGVVAPYATSYNAHTVNHNIAAPYVSAAPVVAKYVAAPAAYAAAPAAYTAYAAAPAAYAAYAAAPAAYAAKYVAAPAAYSAAYSAAPAIAAYSAPYNYPYLF
ncbi:cuticle protein 38-like [Ochlerotatus camptorhynchus]|uniref:cuticle protein 38-like n=1 Tax=Ochlerotatus camptorhynchus TaxID=644619 RepID=UPI0031DCC13F